MCGRYTIVHSHKDLIERFRVTKALIESDFRYNIAPSQTVPIIITEKLETRDNEEHLNDETKSETRVLQAVKWGLIPSWSKDPSKFRPMINARAETIAEKPSFRSAFRKRRCLIPADGFFEWQKQGSKKFPMRITLKDDSLFAFAGLYEDWNAPDGNTIRTCSIITVEANDKMSAIHERMPAILNKSTEDIWLNTEYRKDDESSQRLMSCLIPCPDDQIDYYRVSNAVNSVKNQSPECLEPADPHALDAEESKKSDKASKKQQKKDSDVIQLRIEGL